MSYSRKRAHLSLTFIRSQSSRALLGCVGTGDSHVKTAATVCFCHFNMDQNLWTMFSAHCIINVMNNSGSSENQLESSYWLDIPNIRRCQRVFVISILLFAHLINTSVIQNMVKVLCLNRCALYWNASGLVKVMLSIGDIQPLFQSTLERP